MKNQKFEVNSLILCSFSLHLNNDSCVWHKVSLGSGIDIYEVGLKSIKTGCNLQATSKKWIADCFII